MHKLAMVLMAVAFALPVTNVAAQDGPTIDYTNNYNSKKWPPMKKCRDDRTGVVSINCNRYTTWRGSVSVDVGRGFSTADQGVRLSEGDRIRIKPVRLKSGSSNYGQHPRSNPSTVTLRYPNGCTRTLMRRGIYVVGKCENEDEDEEQQPDEEIEVDEDEESEDLDETEEVDGSGDSGNLLDKVLSKDVLLGAAGGVAATKLVQEIRDNDDDKKESVSP